jgi:pSer/pThr/pTyr-binding forkhead associated (FHA) protein
MARDARAAVLELAAGCNEVGEHLCFEDGPAVIVIPLSHEWTRIGRSLTADVRFEDPTVSRRHALIIRGPDGSRLIDDGGLNGVFLNGERIASSALSHGDEIGIGRHRLIYCASQPSEPRALRERSDRAWLEKRVPSGALAYSGC